MANHYFCTEDAAQYGIEEAVILQNNGYWCGRNLANRQNIKNGRVWTYNTRDAFLEQFPYIAKGKDTKARRVKIGRILQSLESQGAIVSEQLNKSNYDRTKWYSLADMSKLGKYSTFSLEALKTLKEQNCSIGETDMFHQENDSVSSSLSNNKQQIVSSSKPAEAVFQFDLVLAWIITQLSNVHDLNQLDQAFIEASLEEYQAGATKPSKARALSWTEVALLQRLGTESRSIKAGQARDTLNGSVVKQLETQAAVIDGHTKTMQPRKPQTMQEKLTDRSWAEGLILNNVDD